MAPHLETVVVLCRCSAVSEFPVDWTQDRDQEKWVKWGVFRQQPRGIIRMDYLSVQVRQFCSNTYMNKVRIGGWRSCRRGNRIIVRRWIILFVEEPREHDENRCTGSWVISCRGQEYRAVESPRKQDRIYWSTEIKTKSKFSIQRIKLSGTLLYPLYTIWMTKY